MKLLAIPIGFALVFLGGVKLFGFDHMVHHSTSRATAPGTAAAPPASPVKPDADIRAVISYWLTRLGRDAHALEQAGRAHDADRVDDAARRLRADGLRARSALGRQPATTQRGERAKRLARRGFGRFALAGRQLDLAVTTAYVGGAADVMAHARRALVLIVHARRDLEAAEAVLSPNKAPSSGSGVQA